MMIIKETKKYRYVIDKEEYDCNYGTKKQPIYFDYHVRKQCKNDHSKDIDYDYVHYLKTAKQIVKHWIREE
jgi:hypothetical protein